MSIKEDIQFEPTPELFGPDWGILKDNFDYELPRDYRHYNFNQNDVVLRLSERTPYIELYIYDTERWTSEHIHYLRAKLEFHAEVVRNCPEPLYSELWDRLNSGFEDLYLYPMIALIHTEYANHDGGKMLFELSMKWQREGIPHSFCLANNRTRQYQEILWERPKPLTKADFFHAFNRSNSGI